MSSHACYDNDYIIPNDEGYAVHDSNRSLSVVFFSFLQLLAAGEFFCKPYKGSIISWHSTAPTVFLMTEKFILHRAYNGLCYGMQFVFRIV